MTKRDLRNLAVGGALLFVLSGCVSMSLPAPEQVRVPTPISGNAGSYMCPFTSDGTVAEWVQAGLKARFGSALGGAAGAYAGAKACEQIPIVGGLVGGYVGREIGRAVAVKAAGGGEAIKRSSDLSFNSVDDLAVYMYAKHASHPEYSKVLKLTWEIYPKLQKRYLPAIRAARRG